MPHRIDRKIPKPSSTETINLTSGYLWRGFEQLSNKGYRLELSPNAGTILLGEENFPITQTTVLVGAAPLLDLSSFLPENGHSLAIVIDPDAERISHRILSALAKNDIDGAIKMATYGHQQYLDISKNTYSELHQAYSRLREQLANGHFVHLLPFPVENIARRFGSEATFADRVVCLFPALALSIPALFELGRKILKPEGELILQTDSEDILSIAVETALTQGFRQQPFSLQGFVSLYGIAGRNKRVYTLSFRM